MGIKTVPHPPYNPDLAPCEFWLFPKLSGCHYETIEEMKDAVTKVADTHRRGLPSGLPKVVGTVQHGRCSRKRLLRRGLEFHVCTINKSNHAKKSLETHLMILVWHRTSLSLDYPALPSWSNCHLTTVPDSSSISYDTGPVCLLTTPPFHLGPTVALPPYQTLLLFHMTMDLSVFWLPRPSILVLYRNFLHIPIHLL